MGDHIPQLTSFCVSCSLGRNAETSAEQCGGGGAGVEVQDGAVRGTAEAGKL